MTDQEYAGLSLNDKIRHHQIAASEAHSMAGPMFRGGAPVALADMPQIYHTHMARVRNHRDEIDRLRGFIKTERFSA